MRVTVGIAALKEPLIGKCLGALKGYDVIVVTPDVETARVASSMGARVIKEARREGKPSAVNRILRSARGDIIVLTDADMFVDKGSIIALIKPFKDKGVSVVCGRPVVVSQSGMLGYWGEVLYDIVHKQRLAGARHVTTNLCAFRRGCVKSIPSEALVDDYVIGLECLKHGRLVYAPDARVNVKFPSTISDFLKQRVRTFAGYLQVHSWYGSSERSLGQEARKAGSVFSYIKSPKHFVWIVILALLRLYAWFKACFVMGKNIKDVWKPVESTKQ